MSADTAAEPVPGRIDRRTVSAGVRARWTGLPLRAQLVGIMLVLLLAALAVTGFVAQRVFASMMLSQIDDQLIRTASTASLDRGFLNNLTTRDRTRFPSQFVVQVSVDGERQPGPIAGYRNDSEDLPTFPSVSSAQAARLIGQAYTTHADDGTPWRATTFPAMRSDGALAAVTIMQSLNEVDESVQRLRWLILGLGLMVMAAGGILGTIAVRRALVPLREVEDTAAKIAAGDLSQRIPERPPTTEVGSLTGSLNAMLTQIETAFREREASEGRTRRFAADASHELRTPLASVRGYAELYRQGAVPQQDVPRTMQRIEDEAKRMGGLVEDLLLLARLDEQRPTRSAPVDLAVLAGDAVHDLRALAPDRTVRLVGLVGEAPGSAPTLGDEDRLRQVVSNLTGNAVRHTPAGTAIEIAVGTSTDGGRTEAVLEVRDHGRGLSPEHAERVFERFYRADASRRRGTGGGSGLGLSIVAAVAGAHRGTASVRATPGGGATFTVRLPAAPAVP